MKIDYTKKDFSVEERETLFKESEALLEKYPERVPILVQIDSNILKMEKHKFLVANDVTVSYYFDLLKRKLTDLTSSDTLIFVVTKYSQDGQRTLIPIKTLSKTLKEFFDEHRDLSTGMLVITVSRATTYKWAKSVVGYYLGYK